jgi:peptidoglycan/xylan/chitin deacetylase (PgdA/CDA1 family)
MNKSYSTSYCRLLPPLTLLALLLSACQPAPVSTPDTSVALTQALETALAQLQPSATALPTETQTPVPTVTVVRTPPGLPATFVASQLNPIDVPQTYIEDTCQYLYDKWNSNNAAPGTVVMTVMLHGIVKSDKIEDPNAMTVRDFRQMMRDLKEQGFESITAPQLADFLDHNAKIPPRSVLLILDDRRPGSAIDHVYPFLEEYNWTLTLAWLIGEGEDSTDKKPPVFGNSYDQKNGLVFQSLWQQIETYHALGRFDVQAHGFDHNENITSASTEEFIRQEIYNPIPILEQHFGKKPVAYIWPGGSFTPRGAEVAREAGYRLGFTVNPRGPVMYNWIPLSEQADPARPAYLPEGAVSDPRMVLPRYWPYQVQSNLDVVRNIGNAAAAYAEQNKATELEYYDIMCAPTLGQLP